MKHAILLTIFVSLLVPFGILSAAEAEHARDAAAEVKRDSGNSLPQCGELLKECFVRSDNQRANCLYSAGTHPFCEGSELGRLTMKRWSMLPNKTPGNEAPSALLGPQLVNQDCIANFDNTWSSRLVEGDISESTLEKLSGTLDDCKRDLTIDLVRP